MTQHIRVHAVGQSLIEVGRRSFRPDAEMVFATLLVLSADRGRRTERETLASMLWPTEPASRRRHNLRQVLYKLRGAGVEFEETQGPLSIPKIEVWLDFEDQELDAESNTAASMRAVEALPGFAPSLSREFSLWVDSLRTRIESHVRVNIVSAIGAARQDGRWIEVERLARQCLQIDPMNEEANLALAETLALSGGKSRAIALLDAYSSDAGPEGSDIRLPAAILRRRIADRLRAKPQAETTEPTLIGRETLIGAITKTLQASKFGTAGAHVLWGPSGIGKTRVLEEAASIAGLLGGTVYSFSSSTDDRLTPGLSVVRLMKVLQDAPGTLGLDPTVRATLQRLTSKPSFDSELRALDLGDDDLVRMLVDIVRAISEEEFLVVILDDLHHSDPLSLRILGRAYACLRSERICLLVASIPHLEIAGFGTATISKVDRLSLEATRELAKRLLAGSDRIETIEQIEVAAVGSGGNPFVLREMVRSSLMDATVLSAASVKETLRRRVGNLSVEARDVLFTAISLSEHARVALVVGCSSLTAVEIEHGLAELEQEEVCRISESGRISIHSLWTEVGSSLLSTGAALARMFRIANVLESAADHATNSAELLLASASLFERAGDPDRAASALAKGGIELQKRALASGAHAAFSRAVALSPGSQNFDLRLAQTIITGWHARLTSEVVPLVLKFRDRLRACRGLSPEDQAELTVIQVEAPTVAQDFVSHHEALQALESRQNFSSAQRLRLAITGIQSADVNFDNRAVVAIAELAQGIPTVTPGERYISLQIEMAKAMANRDLEEARSLADRVSEGIAHGRTLYEHCRLLLNTRIPFWYDCDFARVEAIVVGVRQIVDSYPGTLEAWRARDIHATHLVDMMRLSEAESIIGEMARASDNLELQGIQRNVRELKTRVALARRDNGATDSMLAALDETPTSTNLRRHRTFALCNAVVGLARAGRSNALPPLVRELGEHWELAASGCPFDYACVALAIGVKSLKSRKESHDLIARYNSSIRIARHGPSPFTNSLVDEFQLPRVGSA